MAPIPMKDCSVKMSEGQVSNIFNYVFYGEMLFRISKEGKNLLKWFGSITWEEF
jgi:hypothetical protein